MMNCADRADNMSLHEYEARLYHWNEAQGSGDIGAPDPVKAQAILDKANRDPRLTKGANPGKGRQRVPAGA